MWIQTQNEGWANHTTNKDAQELPRRERNARREQVGGNRWPRKQKLLQRSREPTQDWEDKEQFSDVTANEPICTSSGSFLVRFYKKQTIPPKALTKLCQPSLAPALWSGEAY